MKEVKLSIIVPLYNTEKYIRRCLESIQAQTLQELEILVVDDGSTDRSPAIVDELARKDKRIHRFRHEENRGLFHARLTGVERARGKYIGFVDSDDYVSRDYFRELLHRAEETGADMVVGKLVQEDEKGYRYIHNTYHSYDFSLPEGMTPWEGYWEQEGRCFAWHTVWNKLYTQKLWQQALPVLQEQTRHLIMTEDFVFSSVLFHYVRKLASVEYGCYFYFQHSGASTSLKGNMEKYRRNLLDLGTAFRFIHNFLQSLKDSEKAEEKFYKWRRLYAFFWYQNIRRSGLGEREQKELISLLCGELEQEENKIQEPVANADWFYRITTPFDSRYLQLVQAITAPEIGCVSFDIFDTAVLRPFYQPTDLFRLMDEEFCHMVPEESRRFSSLRVLAEAELRREKLYTSGASREEITLAEIYQYFQQYTALSQGTVDRLMKMEIQLEITFCTSRRSVQNLYQIAKACGKKIAFTTDMYLSRETITAILKKCGYDTWDFLFISCEEGKTKRTGTLFSLLEEQTGLSPSGIFHIGDNWNSDIEKARSRKINAAFYPSPIDCLQYNISDIKTTHSCCPYTEPSGSMINWEKALDYLGTRTALAMAARKLYDMPFVSFHEWSEMNGDPRFLGYYAVGMHLLSVVKWLAEDSREKGYDTLAFIARDGYLPMLAYEYLRPFYPGGPAPAYLYTSRKAAMAAGVRSVEDLYALGQNLNVNACTPRQFASMISPILRDFDAGWYEEQGISMDFPFGDTHQFCRFVRLLAGKHYDPQTAEQYRKAVAKYAASLLHGKAAVYDIGYSGRTQELLTQLMGEPVDGYYIHENDDACQQRQQRWGFRIHTFYPYTPSITGVARELLFSEYGPSCIGYRILSGTAAPCFEPMEKNYAASWLLEEIQRSALSFVADFCAAFGEYLPEMAMRPMDVSYPYEYFLHTLTDVDARLFDCCVFEDDMWAGDSFVVSEQWKNDIHYHKLLPFYRTADRNHLPSVEKIVYEKAPKTEGERQRDENLCQWFYMKMGINQKSLVSKGLFWLIADRRVFWERVKKYFSGKQERTER